MSTGRWLLVAALEGGETEGVCVCVCAENARIPPEQLLSPAT